MAECNEKLTSHESTCKDKRADERHKFIEERVQPYFTRMGKEVDKIDDKIIPLVGDNILHKEKLISMNEKIDKLTTTLDKFIEKIEKKYATKKDVEENKKDINILKGDRFKFIIWMFIGALGLIGTLVGVIYNIKIG